VQAPDLPWIREAEYGGPALAFARAMRITSHRSTPIVLLLLLSASTACSGEGAPEELGETSEAVSGTTEPGPTEVLVCTEPNYGAGFCQLVGVGFFPYYAGVANDAMSSIKVGSDVRVTLCRDAVYGSTCETLPAGARIAALSSEPIGDNTVSSMRVVRTSVPDCRFGAAPPSGWAFFFRDANYGGDCVSLQPGRYATPEDFGLANDSISSTRALDVIPMVAVDANFGGLKPFGGLPGDNPTLGSFNDVTSSLYF